MSLLTFRPRLESLDERIVPDAAPTATPAPDPMIDTAPGTPGEPRVTDAQLDAAIAALQAQIATLRVQLDEANVIHAALTQEFFAASAAATAANNVHAAEVAKLAGIEAQFGKDSPAYRAQAAVVQGAHDASVAAVNRALGLSEALKVVEERIRNLNQAISDAQLQLILLNAELVKRGRPAIIVGLTDTDTAS